MGSISYGINDIVVINIQSSRGSVMGLVMLLGGSKTRLAQFLKGLPETGNSNIFTFEKGKKHL